MQRINWIDSWKGIAILAVVVGHIVDHSMAKYLFWFHMPLFFFISGFLYRNKYSNLIYIKNKALSLMLPYLSFLVILGALYPWFNSDGRGWTRYILELLYGGEYLKGWFGVFWFITCLFFTQQLYHLLFTRLQNHHWLMFIVIVGFYSLAMINFWFFPGFKFPWCINVVALAIVFYYLGNLAHINSFKFDWLVLALSVFVFIVALIADFFRIIDFNIDMKYSNYGIIGLNIILPLAGIVITQKLAQLLQKSIVGEACNYLGKISLVVMYIHQPVQLTMQNYLGSNEITRIAVSILVACIIYEIINRNRLTKIMLLGEVSK